VETVYNVWVADYHTYFVGGDQWGFAVWTHNASCNLAVDLEKGVWYFKDVEGKIHEAEHLKDIAKLAREQNITLKLAPEFEVARDQLAVAVAKAGERITLRPDDTVIGIIQDGRILRWGASNSTHEFEAQKAGVFVSKGVLKDGAEAFTVGKSLKGEIVVQGSQNFGGANKFSKGTREALQIIFH
jgi:hypothetical protein